VVTVSLELSGPEASRPYIEAARPEIIHILTPPSSHCALAIEALEAGCHVFVEKPMAASVEECDRMMAKAKSVDRIISVDHSARFDPALLKGLAAVHSGRIGAVLAVDYIRSSEYPSFAGGAMPEYYRDGGYPFRDLGVHALYIIEAFLGAESAPQQERFEQRLRAWFAAIERYPRQLHEMERGEYLVMKRKEYLRQQSELQPPPA